LEADFDCVDTPLGGLSLRATGNYGSTVWDPLNDDMMFTAWLCDECFTTLKGSGEHFVFERISPSREEISVEEAMGFIPKVKKINIFHGPEGKELSEEELQKIDEDFMKMPDLLEKDCNPIDTNYTLKEVEQFKDLMQEVDSGILEKWINEVILGQPTLASGELFFGCRWTGEHNCWEEPCGGSGYEDAGDWQPGC